MLRNRWPQAVSLFAVGLGAGAALAMLFAPCSGAETRGYLREAAQDGMDQSIDRSKHRSKQVARRVRRHMGDAAAFAGNVADTATSTFHDARNASLH